MLGQILAIARNTFVESIRQPIFFIMVVLGGLLQIANTLLSAFTMGFTEETEVSGDDKLLLDMGLATVMVCATLLAAFVATSVLSREIENKTALTVISKPVGRPAFVVGKYLGISGALMVATVILTVFFLFAIRHKVMSTARDTADGPVLLFVSLTIFLAVGLAVWGNYFYGWVFSSTAIAVLFPGIVLAYLLTLNISKEWAMQPMSTDLKPGVLVCALCAAMAILVLTGVALAASTRLGQVMTIVVCAGVFVLGLLSNHMLGRYAFVNQSVGTIREVTLPMLPGGEQSVTLTQAGETARVVLVSAAKGDLKPGDSIYYAPDPTGRTMAVPPHPKFAGDPADQRQVFRTDGPQALVIREVGPRVVSTGSALPTEPDAERPAEHRAEDHSDKTRPAHKVRAEDIAGIAGDSFTVVNVGGLRVERPPRAGDYVFLQPTRSNWPARVAWSVVPNLQTFWLVDAVTQGHRIPPKYVALAAGYAAAQVLAMLALAVALFQRRDVG